MSEYSTEPISSPSSHHCQHETDIAIMNRAILEIKDSLIYIKDLMTSNAVLEEQVVGIRAAIKEMKTDIETLKVSAAKQLGSIPWIEKIVWLLISGGAGIFIGKGVM